MLSHGLTIVVNELRRHFTTAYGVPESPNSVAIGNIAEGFASGSGGAGVQRDVLLLSMVNVKEEKTLKNMPHYVRDNTSMRVSYENPPVFLGFTILVAATHTDYANALLVLSRALRYFQAQPVFTHDTVAPASITDGAPQNVLDQLSEFKLVFDLNSPSMEEVNHLWGTLGGKQYPFVLYTLRMLELKYRVVQSEAAMITEINSDFLHISGGSN